MTLCSGIGAPEMAAPWVDWRVASEIEPFPRAVLAERFGYKVPGAHNQGDPLLWDDMTGITPDLLRDHGVPLPNLIVAGTPCQAFSVAGQRDGLNDDRGNLTLQFVRTCHAIVNARPDGKLAVLWENVPGVLSDKGNAFGCLLGGLVGAGDALCPPGGRSWPGVGMVAGPGARAAWSVLDAQWFGVAQRRRRVFVVVDFGNCVDPAAVLLEPDRLRGNTPPRREAGQDVAGSLTASPGGWSGTDTPPGRLIVSEHPYAGTVSSKWAKGSGGPSGDECQNLVAHTLRGGGFDASEDGTGRGTPLVPVVSPTLQAGGNATGGNRPPGTDVDTCETLVPVAFDCKGTEVQSDTSGGETPLRSMGHHQSHSNAGGHAAIAIQERAVSENPDAGPMGAGYRTDDTAYTLEARNKVQAVAFDTTQITSAGNYSQPKPGGPCHPIAAGAHPPAIAFDLRGRDGGAQVESVGETDSLRAADGGSSRSYIAAPWTVRRLTPTECARLQGFPDTHTDITWRGKPAADGPQYKALGNSMAVPVVAWIMDRMRQSMNTTTPTGEE